METPKQQPKDNRETPPDERGAAQEEMIADEAEALAQKEAAFVDALKLEGIPPEKFGEWIKQYGAAFRRAFIKKAQERKFTHSDFEEFTKELERIITGEASLDDYPKLKAFLERVDRKVHETNTTA